MKSVNIEQIIKKTIKQIKIPKNKKILIALSGGKDSALVAYFLKKFEYKIEGFHINLGMGKYSQDCLKSVQELGELLGIKIYYYNIKDEMGSSMCYIRSAVQEKHSTRGLKNCAICGVIKKWILNKEAKKIKDVSLIATGHNLDDECQTFLMNIFKGSPELSANTGVITRNIENEKFIPRIKPLFYVPEDKIREYTKEKKLPVVYEKCPCAIDSYRIQVRKFMNTLKTGKKLNLIKNFEKLYPLIERKKDSRMKFCKICNEPSRKNICKKCELVEV
ncbi:MAG: ATP-binding protein [Nanoarchaeota archaeon]